jgi:hypothetical protein
VICSLIFSRVMATEETGFGKRHGRRPLSVNSYILSLVDSVLGTEASDHRAGDESEATGASRLLPGISRGYEDQYEQFLGGALVYRPNPESDVDKVEIPVSSLADPLNGAFDLSAFGSTGRSISIHTGYKKDIIPANSGKVEIWICPSFLIKQELGTTASYFGLSALAWESPVVYFWTWGSIEPEGVRDGNMIEEICMNNDLDLYVKWTIREATFLRNTRAQKLTASRFFTFKI